MTTPLLIIGAGGHAASLANIALAAGFDLFGFVDEPAAGQTVLGLPVITNAETRARFPGAAYAIGIGDNTTRARVAAQLATDMPQASFPPLIHPSAEIGTGSEIAEGTIIMPRATLGPRCQIGRFCILNTACALDHDGQVGAFTSLAPGMIGGGDLTIGAYSAIGIGAVLKHGVCVGDDVVVGGASYVNKDIPPLVTAYGTPCRVKRARARGDRYLG